MDDWGKLGIRPYALSRDGINYINYFTKIINTFQNMFYIQEGIH